jgi:hypothetical protein
MRSSDDLFRITQMRLSNLRSKVRQAFLVVLGLLFCGFSGYQLYSAVAHGTIRQAIRGGVWVTFQSDPGWFAGSIVVYSLALAVAAAGLGFWLFEYRLTGRWRSRPYLDDAIRQGPHDR